MLLIRSFLVAVILTCCFAQKILAEGSSSYSVETPDAVAAGEGFAFTGEANTPAAVFYNPAGINQMKSTEISFENTVLAPRGRMTQLNGNVVHEQNNEYDIPDFYLVVPVTPNKLSIGIGSGSYWGLGTNWGPNSPLQYGSTHGSIKDVDNSLVASYQVTSKWSIALSADNDYSQVNESWQYQNSAFGFSFGPDGGIEAKGHDDAWGYRVATMLKINDRNQVGLMYRSRINHEYEGKITVNGISPVFQGLFGFTSSNFIIPIDVKSVLPQSVILGYSLKPFSKWTINADVEWMDWSSTKNQTINFEGASALQLGFLNTGNPRPENWHSAWSEAIGTQYDVNDNFRVRLGYYHKERAVPNANFNPVLPDGDSNGYSTGFGLDITKHLTLDLAYSILIYEPRRITNSVASSFAGGVPGTVNGKYNQYVNVGIVSLTYKF